MSFEITIPAAPRRQPSVRYRHESDPGSSSSGSDSSSGRSWPFHLILSPSSPSGTNTDDSAGEGQVVINASDRAGAGVTLRVHLPPRVTWPTSKSLIEWERRVAAEASYSLMSLDTNVATLILDGEALIDRPWDLVATLPALATAVQVAPNFDSVARVHRSKRAYCWMASHPSPRAVLRPKIVNKVLEELKASKQVLFSNIYCDLYWRHGYRSGQVYR